MAGNAKTRARKAKSEKKSIDWTAKFVRDMKKIFETGDTPKHYVGGGQAYTTGKTAK